MQVPAKYASIASWNQSYQMVNLCSRCCKCKPTRIYMPYACWNIAEHQKGEWQIDFCLSKSQKRDKATKPKVNTQRLGHSVRNHNSVHQNGILSMPFDYIYICLWYLQTIFSSPGYRYPLSFPMPIKFRVSIYWTKSNQNSINAKALLVLHILTVRGSYQESPPLKLNTLPLVRQRLSGPELGSLRWRLRFPARAPFLYDWLPGH